MTKLPQIRPTDHHNYIAFFLTLACNLRCPHCINIHNGGLKQARLLKEELTPEEWIRAMNRFILRSDLPLTFQGGEPTLYKGFYRIAKEAKENIKMDLLTNMSFDVNEFIKNVPVWRFTREAPYAPIRVSYHPGQNDIDTLIDKALRMQDTGFRVGIYGILHPDETVRSQILEAQERCLNLGIDFRTKEFLGKWKEKLYGTFKYSGSVCGDKLKLCECKTTELIVGPGGYVYRCHFDLYNSKIPVGHILDENLSEKEIDKFRPCYFYGNCNPCDLKIKTNRFQIFGHTSVEIRNIIDIDEKIESKGP